MQVQLLQAPYDSGQRGIRMGKGPSILWSMGLMCCCANTAGMWKSKP